MLYYTINSMQAGIIGKELKVYSIV